VPALRKSSIASGMNDVPKKQVEETQVVAMRMDIQIYEMERGVFLVDFKVDGYETPDGKLIEDKEVMSPFPFLDMAAQLIMQLAEAD
jgi:carbon catabolite-derepressing protein kinase